MKKHISHIAIALLFVNLIFPVYAVTESTTSTSSADVSPVDKRVEELKDKLATKVAELQKLERRAITGSVKSKTISILTVEMKTKDMKIELSDDIKVIQYLKGKRTSLTIDDVDTGDNVVVFGEYNTVVEIMKPKVILINNTETPERITGTITEVKKPEYTVTIQTKEGVAYVVDYESSTKTSVWSSNETKKGGFSDMVVGETSSILGTKVPKKENRLSALRILVLGNLTGVQVVASPRETPTEKETSPTPTEKE